MARFSAVRHRVIRVDELAELGVARSSVSRWMVRGRLRRRHRGVYVYGSGELTREGEFYAAQKAIGDDAAVGYFAAAAMFNFWPGGTTPVDIVVPRRVTERRGIRVHMVTELPDTAVTVLEGIRLTTPEQAILDLAGIMYSQRHFRRLVHEAFVQKQTDHDRLMLQVSRAPSYTSAIARVLAELAYGETPTRSGTEDDLVEILRKGDFPPFKTCAHPPATPYWVEVDVLFTRPRLVIEVDAGPWHSTPFRREFDAHKRKIVADAGYPVLVLDEDDVKREAETVARVRRELSAT